MPRAHRDHLTPEFDAALDALRKDVIARVGVEMTSVRDCKLLQAQMSAHDERFQLGLTTLRRFFLLIPSNNKFSHSTLNALARFVRRNGFAYYTELAAIRMVSINKVNWEVFMVPRLKVAASPSLESMISEIEHTTFTQIGGYYMHQLLGCLIPAYERGLTAAEIDLILQNPRARRLIMEATPPLSWMHGFGKTMFERFLEGAQREEERVYAIGVLAMGALFCGELTESRILVEGLEINTISRVHILPSTRVMGMQWLFAALMEDEVEMRRHWENLEDGYAMRAHWAADFLPDWEIHFASMAAQILIISGKTSHLKHHLAYIDSLQNRVDLRMESGSELALLSIYAAWMLHRIGKSAEAAAIFLELSPKAYFPFDEASAGMMYHVLGERLDPSHHLKHREASDRLVQKSNYTWLLEQLRSLL